MAKNELLQKSLQGAVMGLSFWVALLAVWAAYASWWILAQVGTASSWSPLASGEWNKIVADLWTVDSELASINGSVTTAANNAASALAKSVPSGAVMAFNLGSCPTGWSAFASANGRAVVWVGSDGQWNSYSLLNSGGEARHTLSTGEMPSHTHGFTIGTTDDNNAPWNVALLQLGDNGPYSWASFTTAATGGGASHENRMPYVALLYCVKN